jgi:hypothetical protein
MVIASRHRVLIASRKDERSDYQAILFLITPTMAATIDNEAGAIRLRDRIRRREVACSHEAGLSAPHHSIRDKRSDEFLGGFR